MEICRITIGVLIELSISVEGMINYRVFPRRELKRKRITATPPKDMHGSDKYFFDISRHEPAYEFVDHKVKSVTARGTDTWGFSQEDFDEVEAERASYRSDLPAEIILALDNGTRIGFIGDIIENSRIALRKDST